MTRRPSTAALLTLALLGASMKAPSSVAIESVEEPTYLPAGVSDSGGIVGCLQTPKGGVEAVDLAKGRSLWRSAAPARALVIARGRAFVLEERAGRRLRVAAYTERSGRLVRAYETSRGSICPRGRPWPRPKRDGSGRCSRSRRGSRGTGSRSVSTRRGCGPTDFECRGRSAGSRG